MKKKISRQRMPLGQVIAMGAFVLLGAAAGFMIASYAGSLLADASFGELLLTMGLMLLGLYAAIMAQIILHEAGHLLGGLMTGYQFLSFRVGSFMWEKGAEGKIRLHRFSLAGTGGQCLMAPPDMTDGRFPYAVYNLSGSGMNLLLAVLFTRLALHSTGAAQLICWIMALTGLVVGLVNGVPLHLLHVDNDGSNTLSISRSPQALRAFWLQMKINQQSALGVRLKDMPEEWFTPASATDNAMTASMEVFRANRMMDAMDFAAAAPLMRSLLSGKNKVPGIYRSLMLLDLITIELLQGRPSVCTQRLDGTDMQKFMKMMKDYPSVLRTQYIAALLRDHDAARARDVHARFEKMAARYPHPCELESERALMTMALQHSCQNKE